MGVLKSKQNLSNLEFYRTATIIRADLTRFVMNEKNVPKRWRPVFTFPMIEKLTELIDVIIAANTIYPQSFHEAEMRRDYQTKAIIVLEQIQQELIFLLSTLPVDPDKLQPIEELILKELALVKGWRKSDYSKIYCKFTNNESGQ